jgi:hypothetical protein
MFNAGGLVMQEGQPAPTAAGATEGFIDFIPTGFGRFDDANNLVFGIRARPMQPVGGTSADANRVMLWDGSTLSLAFKQGDLYFDLVDVPANPAGDETVGNSVGSYHLLNNGAVGSHDTTIGNIHSTRRPAITYNRVQFHQVNVTSVTALGGSGSVTWTGLDGNGFYTTPDGEHWWARGVAGGLEIMAYDGAVVLQEDSPAAGTGPLIGDIFQVHMASGGDWISRGRDNSGTSAAAPDWIVRNGAMLAQTGDPITPKSSERWGDTIYAVAINSSGDYLVVGNTDNGDPAADSVVVLNGETVLLREGDAVDLDGNGMFDDDAFVGRGVNTNTAFGASSSGNPNSWWLSDDGVVHGIIMLHDAAGNDLTSVPSFGTPQAFVRIGGGDTCAADFNNDELVNSQDFFDFLTAFFATDPAADFNGDDVINSQDFFDFLTAFFAGC